MQFSICSLPGIVTKCPQCSRVFSEGEILVVLEMGAEVSVLASEPVDCCGDKIYTPRIFSKDTEVETIQRLVGQEVESRDLAMLSLDVLGDQALAVMLALGRDTVPNN